MLSRLVGGHQVAMEAFHERTGSGCLTDWYQNYSCSLVGKGMHHSTSQQQCFTGQGGVVGMVQMV